MPAPYDYQFDRKTLTGGAYATSAHGYPTLAALIEAAFPTRQFTTDAEGAALHVLFQDEPDLTSGEQTTLTNTYTAWDPDSSPPDAGPSETVRLYPDTSFGIPGVSVLNLPDDTTALVKSWQIEANPNTIEIFDVYIGDDLVGPKGECFLAGGEYRCRTSATEGSALHFEIVDRNDVLGAFTPYGLSRTKLSGLTNFSGGTIDDISVGDTAVGATSAASTKVLAVGADYLEVQFHEADFQDGESVTMQDSNGDPTGITFDLGTWDEGDVLVLTTMLKDEWIEGYDVRDMHPGGSRQVPESMYFRVKLYNADLLTNLRVKVSLTTGKR